ncbi:hypothetical protein [Streptomyces sp. H27-D2]|uniref:hypothetical protein n=1 Tax=Streptomyces sp. H27-D2 TaxID=3046304 RepID=UPI002DB8B68D|nr:hypothetical protein [Streptomyces sp. H27-D2]MEC4017671.1 hypothetical protein [Streptomyces sp. H27-D2]
MRPTRFLPFALDLAEQSPEAGSAMTLREAGDNKHTAGLTVKPAGAEARFQFVAQSANGDNYDQTELPVEGEPISPEAVSDGGTPAERWLAELLGASRNAEIMRVEIWSVREGDNGHPGVTTHFHSGARVFARVL